MDWQGLCVGQRRSLRTPPPWRLCWCLTDAEEVPAMRRAKRQFGNAKGTLKHRYPRQGLRQNERRERLDSTTARHEEHPKAPRRGPVSETQANATPLRQAPTARTATERETLRPPASAPHRRRLGHSEATIAYQRNLRAGTRAPP